MNLGGAETLVMNMYRQMDRSQVQFDIAVQSDQPGHFDAEVVALGGRILPHPPPDVVGFRPYGQALARTLREHGPFTGVHSHVHYFSGYVLAVARRAGVPLRLAHSHTTQDGKGNSWPRRAYRYYMRRLLQQHATHMLGCSRSACETLFGPACWQDSRVEVLANAIDLASYGETRPGERNALRQKLSLPVDSFLIGHVGRFSPVKNHRFLIEVFAALLPKLPQARLVLIGDGPLQSEIEKWLQTRGLSAKAHLLGTRSDVPQILNALDLILFPSLYEGLGIVLIEAQAAGVPCVVAATVPKDVDIHIGLVQFVSLQATLDVWVQALLSALKMRRPPWRERQRALEAAGYDIRRVALRLQEIYTDAK
jgi:glycosyltransferase involved in cell wall biosynthesis